ncbi:MAG: protease modulator HflC [Legionellaceae bacterium]|nr:protease modulator HflC [Legionellaceae bacterium]
MRPWKMLLGLVMVAVLLVSAFSLFIIQEGQNGILLRLGRLVLNPSGKVVVLDPGLHIKFPLIESFRIFDTRLQTLAIKSSRMVTKEKKDVIVDYYVKWRIVDLAQYYKSTGGNQLQAETLLEQQLNTTLRAAFGRRAIAELVSGGREDVMDVLRDKAQEQAFGLGIRVVDVRLKGIELPENTSQAIYERMRADMQKIANKHRADGQAEASVIRATVDGKVTVVLARARSEAQQARAKGDADAASLYADVFSQNKTFFYIYRSMQAYKASFKDQRDILILDGNSAFFKYFKEGPLHATGNTVATEKH